MGFTRVGFRIVLFSMLWWVITEGDISSWYIGAPMVVFAVFASVVLLPDVPWSLRGFARFVPFFLWRSLCGGADVARRALHPRLPISPGLHVYRWRLPPGLPRVFMANTISLLPGTLSVELEKDLLHVHVLDDTRPIDRDLEVLEKKVARVFGLDLVTAVSEE